MKTILIVSRKEIIRRNTWKRSKAEGKKEERPFLLNEVLEMIKWERMGSENGAIVRPFWEGGRKG